MFNHAKRPLSLLIEDWRAVLEAKARPWYAHLFNDVFTTIFLIFGVVGGISYSSPAHVASARSRACRMGTCLRGSEWGNGNAPAPDPES